MLLKCSSERKKLADSFFYLCLAELVQESRHRSTTGQEEWKAARPHRRAEAGNQVSGQLVNTFNQ